jgi:hypothetical protein
MANRLPLCGYELYSISPSNDPEKPINEPVKKQRAPRGTTELPISVAIEKIRELDDAQQLETDTEIRAVGTRIAVKYNERRLKVLSRIPEDFTGHVLAKARGEEPSRSTDVQSDVNSGIASDADTSWPNE